MTDLAIELLGKPENSAAQFFAWFHYMDPHDQYMTHKESPDWGRTARDKYDSEVFYTDLHIGRLLDWARKQAWWEKTAVIISADHGEAFGEHSFYKHAFWLWDVITRVPLVFYVPGAEHRVINQRRSHIDVAPTILELMKIAKKPASFQGVSLVPEMFGAEEPKARDVIVLDLPEDSHNPPIRAIISGDYKILQYGGYRWELYNLETDPGEKTELSKAEPEVFEKMKSKFEATWAAIPAVKPFGGMKLRGGAIANGPTAPTAAPTAQPTPAGTSR
jgi:choline-sulfatase